MTRSLIMKGGRLFLILSAVVVTLYFGYMLFILIMNVYFPPVTAYITLREVNISKAEADIVHLEQADLIESQDLTFLMEHGYASMTGEEWNSLQQRYFHAYLVEYNGTYYAMSVGIHRGEQ